MPTPPHIWKETTVDGARTRRWSLDAKQCPELKTQHIAWLGIDTVHAPYSRVRLAPSGSFFLACLEGEGRVWLEGRWQRVAAGSLCLAPPRVLNAFHAVPGKRWVFAWVRYDEAPWTKPLVGAGSPLRQAQGAEEFGRVIAGLRAEWEGDREADMVRHWVSLAHGLAWRRARPWRSGSRVGALWETVARDLTAEWKLGTLAKECSLSAEHLRRLCRRELGRTPMEHVTYMRIQRAQELLATTGDKLDAIAPRVGYRSAVVFSRAFVRCTGMTPTEYRERGGAR
ncbi:MAG: AraC family transcriptional regulator [Verrucomicrobia bacterium]|nr:AraC family transcriptional regulator [Verrucomicrobiota bacterium]